MILHLGTWFLPTVITLNLKNLNVCERTDKHELYEPSVLVSLLSTPTYTATVTSAEKGWSCSHDCRHSPSEACSGLTSEVNSYSRVPPF